MSVVNGSFVVMSPAGAWECVVRADGEMDLGTCPEFRQVVEEVLRGRSSTLIVDMADVTFMDSAGVNALIGALNECQTAGVELVVQAPSARVLRVLEVTRLDRLFNLVLAPAARLAAPPST
jgi:anti-sigma B factor antagonist